MGLINCPKCGKQVSDKAVSCPQCNFDLSNQSLIVCTECGCTYANMEACPQCGCPKTVVTAKAPKKKRTGIIIAVVAIAVVIALLLLGVQKIREVIYYSKMEEIVYVMLDSAAETEDAGNLIVSVWHNVIYGVDDVTTDKFTKAESKYGGKYFVSDFNVALSNLFADSEFSYSITKIENERADITACMKELKDPPKKYEDAYEALKTYYDNYMKFTDIVIKCDGSLNSFSEEFGEYDEKTVDCFNKMCFYLN